ncbi:MmcQ/YjbR family DNA-binding protein [Cellulosilyticum sp. I15G10I2]|uniref:MmcQ/YjbR family DNA-binding protein n=1 Tax=Cellulosilyticum sp. I15G10I2 TaxID=1892843 RepID=UPI00085BAEEF|nr:MmcQ/YjbR family DNA-binding protein [Cellulosilyticum sp. I15G10I2]
MKYEWLDAYCLSKIGAEKDFKEEWQATRYMLGGKMFALRGGDKEGKQIITLKLEPPHGQFLRQQYKDIIAGYYMNKDHWNSLYLEGEVPDEVLKDMIDRSYHLIFKALPKKVQMDLNQQHKN